MIMHDQLAFKSSYKPSCKCLYDYWRYKGVCRASANLSILTDENHNFSGGQKMLLDNH